MTSEKAMSWLLRIISAFYWFLLLIFCLLAISSAISLKDIDGFSHSVTIPVELDEQLYTLTPTNPEFKSVELAGLEANVTYEGGLGFSDRLELVLFILLALGLYIVVLHRLRAILRSILMTKHITARAVFDMRLVSWLIILAYLSTYFPVSLGSGQDFAFAGALVPAGEVINETFDLEIDLLGGLLPGLILLAVAEIMNYARKLELERDSLREEQALTV